MDIDLSGLSGPVTANGDYFIDIPAGEEVVMEVDGDFGGRTVTLAWKSAAGNWHPIKDGGDQPEEHTAAFIGRVLAGRTGRVGIQVTGVGDAPSLRPAWASVSRRPGREVIGEVPAAV